MTNTKITDTHDALMLMNEMRAGRWTYFGRNFPRDRATSLALDELVELGWVYSRVEEGEESFRLSPLGLDALGAATASAEAELGYWTTRVPL